MAPLILEGETLGQRHRHLNKLVKGALDQEVELAPLNYDDPDVDNLLRIDVACSRRNVDYVLDVLQCDDMLYVSRAIKRSTWLITDDQYAHIINPQHLYNELFLKMTAKAQKKLILAIRLNLKNESRVEEFFHYYSDDIKVAQKWLPHCSSALKEQVYKDYKIDDIKSDNFKRQCESSENPIKILKTLVKNRGWTYIGDKLTASKILLNKFPEEYLNIMINKVDHYDIPQFGVHATKQLMKNCPDKVMNDFYKLSRCVHLATFAKCLKNDDIKSFLIKQAVDKNMKEWITYDNIKHFVKYLPVTDRFKFVKKLFIDKEVPTTSAKSEKTINGEDQQTVFSDRRGAPSSNAHIYHWYHFAPFDVAFTTLQKLIRVESSPAERNSMLIVLLHTARRNPQQIYTVLKFYREKHMNEPFKFKVHFVNTLLSLVDAHKFDTDSWGILNEIFSSMEVFIESDNNVLQCVKAVIVYKLLHNEDITEIFEEKLNSDTFKDYHKKLDDVERDIVFTYLYKLEMNKLIKILPTDKGDGFTPAFDQLLNVINLLKDWKKDISDYPEVLEKIKYFIKIKKENTMKNNLSAIYCDAEKKWRRHLFEETLALVPDDEACINVLRHDPELFLRCSSDVAAICSDDNISLKVTLRKIRLFWPQTLAEQWAEAYLKALNKPTGHKAAIEGICIILPRKRILDFLKKYAPVEANIDWANTDTNMLSLQKNIAKSLILIRPSINLDAVLSYAKGDYLQFVIPSLDALMSNMSAAQVSENISLLLNTPISLKKHALRLVFRRIKFSEIKDLIENMWKDTHNLSIRTVLFKQTFQLLKKEKNDSAIGDLWELLNMFIENLTPDDNRIIYNILSKAALVPLSVRPQFFMKSYKYLKSLPAQANCDSILEYLDRHAPEIIELLEPDFVEDFLLPPVHEFVLFMTGKKESNSMFYLSTKFDILASYVVQLKNEDSQLMAYEKYLVPILDGCFESFNVLKSGSYTVRENCNDLVRYLVNHIKARTLKTSTVNVQIFKDIERKFRTGLPIEENYQLITSWSITVLFVESLKLNSNTTKSDNAAQTISGEQNYSVNKIRAEKEKTEKWDDICIAVSPSFGKSCLNYIKQDMLSQTNTLLNRFVFSIKDILNQFKFGYIPRLHLAKHMMDIDVTMSYLVALDIVSESCYERNENKHKLRREVLDIIKSHPSSEVKIHYWEIEHVYRHLDVVISDDDNETDDTLREED